MTNNSKDFEEAAPEIQHLSGSQRSKLPDALFEFLVKETGNAETAMNLAPKKLREYAADFLDSEEGRTYWPLSANFSQWNHEATHPEVQRWLGELLLSITNGKLVRMINRKQKHLENIATPDDNNDQDDDTIVVDASPAPKKPPGPSLSKGKTISRARSTGKATQRPRKDAATPSKRIKPPIVTSDMSQEELPPRSIFTPKISTRSSTASTYIAERNSGVRDKIQLVI